MDFLLKEVADVQVGFPFRERLTFDHSGNVNIVQMRDINDTNTIDAAKLTRTTIANGYNKFLLQTKDLIFCPRGLIYTTTFVSQTLHATILTAPLVLIRIKQTELLPAYLQWFINQPLTQKYFTSRAVGTTVKLISKSVLGELKISVPSLAKQQTIVDIAKLYTHEQQLQKLLALKRKKYYEKLLMQFVSGNPLAN